MAKKTILARARTATGKGAAKVLRSEGRLPAVVYDREGKSILIDIDNHEFQLLYRTITKSTLVTINLDKDELVAFIKDAQYDIISDTVKHVDFYQVEAGKVLRAKIIIKTHGSPDGIRLGGAVEMGTNEIEVECLPKDLPERLDVDISKLGLGETIHVRDLIVPEGVTILTHEDVDIVTLKGKRASAAEEEVALEEAADGANAAAEGAEPTAE